MTIEKAIETKPPKPGSDVDSRNVIPFRNRLLMLVGLVSITFFFDGCESGEPEFTVGVVPFAQCSFGDLGWGKPVKFLSFWIVGLVLNLAVIGMAIYALLFGKSKQIRIVRQFLSWRVAGVAIILTVAIFNSFLLVPGVWMYGVFTPTSWILNPFGDDPPILATRLVGRLLFAGWVLLLSGVLIGLGKLLARFVLVDARRWWQVKLGGAFVLMVVLGTLLGVIGRIVVQNSNPATEEKTVIKDPKQIIIVDPSTSGASGKGSPAK